MLLVKRLLDILQNIKFILPQAHPVMIYDKTNSELLTDFVLEGTRCTVLEAREERIYITIRLLCRIYQNWRIHFRSINNSENFDIYALFRSFRLSYFLSIVQLLNPRVVVTFIDNSATFQWLSFADKARCYIAIQNGVRLPELDLKRYLPIFPHFGHRIMHTNFACFGKYEDDCYREKGHLIENCYSIGSLKAGIFLDKHPPITATNYDICLISQWHHEMGGGGVST